MLKKIFIPLMLSAACALFLVGCGGSETTSTNTTSDTAGSKSTTSSTPSTPSTPATTSSPATTTSTSGEKIGVPECDDFLAKYEACVLSKVPAAARAQYESSLATWRKTWRETASTPQGKAGLAMGCKMASDQSKTSMKSFGCEF